MRGNTMALQLTTSRSLISKNLVGAFIAIFAILVQPLITLNVPSAFAASGTTRTVCASGCDFTTVQPAVDASISGDIVNIKPGTYDASQFLVLAAQAGITVTGGGTSNTFLNLSAISDGFKVQANNVTLKNFTITSNSVVANYGLRAQNISGLTVQNVQITKMKKTAFDINGVSGSSFSTIRAKDNGGAGIYITDSNNLTFTNTTTSGNAWGAIGLTAKGTFYPCGSNNITFSGVLNLAESTPIYAETDTPNDPDCRVTDVTVPVSVLPYRVTPSKNVIKDFYTRSLSDAQALASVPGADSPVIRSNTDDSLVVTSGLKIQDAINAALTGDTVNVASGAYGESLVANKSITLKGVQAGIDARNRSGSESVLNAVGASSNFTIASGVSDVTFDGFTLNGPVSGQAINMNGSGGSAVITNNIINNKSRAANFNVSNITFSNNRINNADTSNYISGFEENSSAAHNIVIDSNDFYDGTAGADINFIGTPSTKSTGLVVRNNKSLNGVSFLGLANTAGALVEGNTITGTPERSIFLAGGNSNTKINGNRIDTANPTGAAVILHNPFGYGINTGVEGRTNDFSGSINGVVAFPGSVDSVASVNFQGNYWGAVSGPKDIDAADGSSPTRNAVGNGAAAYGSVNYGPWCVSVSCAELSDHAPVAAITRPTNNANVRGLVSIAGTITDTDPRISLITVTSKNTNQVVASSYSIAGLSAPTLEWDTKSGNSPDGLYTIKIEARDIQNNKDATSVSAHTVKVDNTTPVISNVRFKDADSTYIENNKGVLLYFTLSEPLASMPEVKIGGKVASVNYENVATSTYRAYVFADNSVPEGVVEIEVKATDAAGNTSDTVTSTTDGSRVVVDRSNPVVTLASSINGRSNEDATVSLKVTDISLDYYTYCVEKDGVKLTNCIEQYVATSLDTTRTYKESGVYKITLNARDKLGHEGSEEVTFIIDKDGPVSVNAGEDQAVIGLTTTLDGGSDDGVSYEWGIVSGPGLVTFVSPNSASTNVSVSLYGDYIFSLTASDDLGNRSAPTLVSVKFSAAFTPVDLTVDGIDALPQITTTIEEQVTPNRTNTNVSREVVVATSNDIDNEGDVLGTKDAKSPIETSAVITPSEEGWKLLGMAWYWWAAIIAAVGGLGWYGLSWFRGRSTI